MKITVTCSPCTKGFQSKYPIEKYKAVVNVSDTPETTFEFADKGIPSFWFPVNEIHLWGYSPFYGTAKVIDKYCDILLHCHAGVNRSKSIAYAILKTEDMSDEEIKIHIKDDVARLFESNIRKGYIYPDIIRFLKERKNYPTYSIMGLLQSIESPNLIYKK